MSTREDNLPGLEMWQQRLIAERNELASRLEKLGHTIGRMNAGTLDYEPLCPVERLEDQRSAMRDYLDILDERIGVEVPGYGGR